MHSETEQLRATAGLHEGASEGAYAAAVDYKVGEAPDTHERHRKVLQLEQRSDRRRRGAAHETRVEAHEQRARRQREHHVRQRHRHRRQRARQGHLRPALI